MRNRANDTDRTGWGEAKVQLSGELNYDPDAEITECAPPHSDRSEGLGLDDDKIAKAEADRDYVNSLLS